MEDSAKLAFLSVGMVEAGSPAAAAGLETGDGIIQFGSLQATNFRHLSAMSDLLSHSEGVGQGQPYGLHLLFTILSVTLILVDTGVMMLWQNVVRVTVRRQGQHARLLLKPERWAGKGLLG